jgi:hypothetical protein
MRLPPSLSFLPALLASLPALAQPPRFLPDDPLRVDRDDLPIARPQEIELSTAYDVIEHTFFHRPDGPIPPALNANTLGEVPDSSWFTERIGVRDLTLEELVRGPDRGTGPDASGPWTVLSGKSQGITPGFTARDARGDVYFVKFDRREYKHLSTAAEVISTKFFHALGYFVPENHLTHFRRDQLVIGEGARIAVKGGPRRKMTEADLDHLLRNVERQPDGTLRAVASLRLAGTPLGPHKYHGTRGDDPNDVFPHEHRRDLRGLRVFSAWLNHDDSRSVNSLDMYVGEEGRGHVRHYLIDFSSTLGSGSNAERQIAPQSPRAGHEYVIDWGPMLRSAATFGLWERPWRRVRYPDHPEIGRIEAAHFDPLRWKPEYPNPAFERMQPADAYWAAKRVARFSDEAIRAVVATGGYRDPRQEAYLADTLIARRNKTVAACFRLLNPLDRFRLEGDEGARVLAFDNLGERAGLGRAEAYEYEWSAFDSVTGARRAVSVPGRTTQTAVALPAAAEALLVVRLRTVSAEPNWRRAVDVFLMDGTVVGIEREGGHTGRVME